MAVLNWRIPAFNTSRIYSEPLTINVRNFFMTEYDDGSAFDGDYSMDAKDRDELEWYFGTLVSSVYYALYVRSYLTSNVEHINDVEQLELLDALCNEVDYYVWRSRETIKAIDATYDEYQEHKGPGPSGQLSEGFIGSLDAQNGLSSFLRGLYSAIRFSISNDGESRSGELYYLRRQFPGLTQRFHLDSLPWWQGMADLVYSILDTLETEDPENGQHLYGEIPHSMGTFYEGRFEYIAELQEISGISLPLDENLECVISNRTYGAFFLRQREDAINRCEATLYDSLLTVDPLTRENVERKIQTLREIASGIKPRTRAGNFMEEYFREKDMMTGYGGCFAIMQIDGEDKDFAALSGCLDGSERIAEFFGYTTNPKDEISPYNSFQLSLEKFCDSPGFQAEFVLTPIAESVSYFYKSDETIERLELREFMEKVEDGITEERMFSCCEKKILASLEKQFDSPDYHDDDPLSCTLIIKKCPCRICDSALQHFREHHPVSIRILPEGCKSREESYDSFAKKVGKHTAPPKINAFEPSSLL